MTAIIEAYRAGLLKPKNWLPNIIAGLIVGVVALPLAMAFAIASGVKPEQGLYTAIFAGFIVGIFGGSRIQIAGPTGAFIVILANITAHYGVSGLQLASLMAGFILILMGLMRLGNVIKFIPEPVIVGFTSGIGVLIFVGEWKDFFGLSIKLPIDLHFHQKLWALLHALPHLYLPTTALGCLSLILVIATPKIIKRIPGPLIAMIVATALQSIYHFNGVATLGSTFGGIPQHFPRFQFPDWSFSKIDSLMGSALTIALLGAIESLLSATAADGMAKTRHRSNQELLGQGLANIVSPLFGGFAATGAIARTATNIRQGGNSPLSAIVHSILLLALVVFLAPLFFNIPLCSLAAILFVVCYNMSDIPHFIHIIKHAPYYDILVLLITFFLTIFTNLVIAVNVGVILAMLFFVGRMHDMIEVTQEKLDGINLPSDVLVYAIQGPFFFGAAEKIERALVTLNLAPNVIIFRLKNVPFMDMTGLETFSELIEEYTKKHVKVYLCEANPRVTRKITEVGIVQWIQEKRIFNSLSEITPRVMHS